MNFPFTVFSPWRPTMFTVRPLRREFRFERNSTEFDGNIWWRGIVRSKSKLFQEATLSRSYPRVLHASPLPPPCPQPLGHLLISRSTDQSKFVPTIREERTKRALFPFSICYSCTLSLFSSSLLLTLILVLGFLLPIVPLVFSSTHYQSWIFCWNFAAKVYERWVFSGYSWIRCTEPTRHYLWCSIVIM